MHSVEACGGWPAARRGECGVSTVVLWDSEDDRPHIYGEENIDLCMEHLNKADMLVSFNGKNFDVPCLEGYTGIGIEVSQHFDILDKIWKALGSKPKGWGLGKVCERTLGLTKSDVGEHAPALAEQGHWATLIDYCLNDVYITKKLFFHIALTGYVIGPDGEQVFIEAPGELTNVLW